jgi:hypothetical protein
VVVVGLGLGVWKYWQGQTEAMLEAYHQVRHPLLFCSLRVFGLIDLSMVRGWHALL